MPDEPLTEEDLHRLEVQDLSYPHDALESHHRATRAGKRLLAEVRRLRARVKELEDRHDQEWMAKEDRDAFRN